MTRKLKKSVLLALLLFFMSVGSSYAAWYNCTVNTVGPFGETLFLRLTHADGNAFSNRWFRVNSNINQSLATALTAISADMILQVNLGSTAAYSEITNLYLLKN